MRAGKDTMARTDLGVFTPDLGPKNKQPVATCLPVAKSFVTGCQICAITVGRPAKFESQMATNTWYCETHPKWGASGVYLYFTLRL